MEKRSKKTHEKQREKTLEIKKKGREKSEEKRNRW